VEIGRLEKVGWSKSKLKVETENVKDGAEILCFVLAAECGGQEKIAEIIEGRISGNIFEVEWNPPAGSESVRHRIFAYSGYGMILSEILAYSGNPE